MQDSKSLLKMLAVSIFISTLFLIVKGDNSHINAGYYIATVYEHARFGEFPKDTMPDIIEKNLMAYENATSVAAEKDADIIVFPEFGLYPFTNRIIFKEYGEYIPDPKEESWNPCLSREVSENSSIARRLSCMARQNNIFLVANMISSQPCNSTDPDCLLDNVYIYNTNVVFNREGNLVARYRKYHLYFEPGVDTPKEFEYVTFTTEFGTMGTFVCFDIMWKPSVELLKKYEVDAIVYPLLWHDGLPMYTSMQTMWSWSVGNNINLLGANIQQPYKGNVGSGIFLGASKVAHYDYEPDGKSKLIVAKVPTRASENASGPATIIEFENDWANATYNDLNSGQCSSKILGPPKKIFDYRCADMSLSNFTLVKLQKDNDRAMGCNNRLCCEVIYDAVDMNEDYYLAVRNSTLDMSTNYRIWEENCLVVRCDQFNGTECSTFPTKANTVFRHLTINANLTSTHVYPSVLISGIHLLAPEKWSYTPTSLSLETDDGLLYAVLNGRSYDRDPPYIP